jgi:hypothetical protein
MRNVKENVGSEAEGTVTTYLQQKTPHFLHEVPSASGSARNDQCCNITDVKLSLCKP